MRGAFGFGSTDFQNVDDEELVALAQGGNEYAVEYLILRYRSLIFGKAKAFFIYGADRDDVLQEATIGLYKAVRDYRADRNASFRSFAEMCITRQIITSIKMATRKKHAPLNSYLSLNAPTGDDGGSDRTLFDLVSDPSALDPELIWIGNEELRWVEAELERTLSQLEKDVLVRYLDGKSYQEISVEIGKPIKSVDSAIYRMKRKAQRAVGKARE